MAMSLGSAARDGTGKHSADRVVLLLSAKKDVADRHFTRVERRSGRGRRVPLRRTCLLSSLAVAEGTRVDPVPEERTRHVPRHE
jgi:hypothetical protein